MIIILISLFPSTLYYIRQNEKNYNGNGDSWNHDDLKNASPMKYFQYMWSHYTVDDGNYINDFCHKYHSK